MLVTDRIDRTADRALYRQLADVLRERIVSGQLEPGQDLPTEAALARDYDVGRDTVRDAIGVLRSEGLVGSERGRPAWVRDLAAVETVTLGPGDQVDYAGTGTVVVTRAGGTTETYAAGAVRIVGAGS